MRTDEIASRAEQVTADIRARGAHVGLRYADVVTGYCSDEDPSADWIRQFFEGYLTECDARTADATVYSSGDPALFAALQDLAPGELAAGRRGYEEVPLTGSVTVIRTEADKVTPPEDVFLVLFPRQRAILLVTSGHPEVRREEGMQILRAVSKWLLLDRGWIPMHSACAARYGRTICVTGLKAAGKTSTLLNLLARNGCDLLAVDKFLLRDGGSHLEVRGIPGKIGIRVGSAIVQPRVLDWLGDPGPHFFPHLGLDEVRSIAATRTPAELRTRKEKIHMTPAELSGLFGRSITPSAPLGLVLIPVFDLHAEAARLVAVEPEQVIRLLTTCYVGLLSKGEGYLRHLFPLDDALFQARLATLLGTYLPGVPSWELHQNHRTNEQAAELVAGLL
jgi:hypothetical protein